MRKLISLLKLKSCSKMNSNSKRQILQMMSTNRLCRVEDFLYFKCFKMDPRISKGKPIIIIENKSQKIDL